MTFAANLRSRSSVQRATLCLVLAGVAQALLGGYQFFTQSGPEFFALRGRFMRAYGTFEQPNPYGGYLGLVAPLALALGFPLLNDWRQALRHWRKRWLNWVALGSFVVISVAIGMSWSRGAWLGFGAALVVVSLAWSRRMALVSSIIILLAASTGLLGGFRLVPASITQRLTSFLPFVGVQDVRAIEITDENYASVERLAHWESALDMWRDHPWVGVGFGNYQAIYAEYALPKWPMALGHAHNYYLNVAAETGLLGIVTYLFFVGSAFWQTWHNIRHIQDPLIKATALGALGLLVHTSVHNLVDNLWVQNMYTHLAIVLGLAQSAVQAQTDPG
jgi:O-antigen ligase